MNGDVDGPAKAQLRALIRDDLETIVANLNRAMAGQDLESLRPVLQRVGRGGAVPHWYEQLEETGTLPNMDGKTVGSVIEMLLVGVLETTTFAELDTPPLQINPAQGIDLPDLDLGVKCPSENFCTSEPFFSPYERLLGNEFDAVILLTDYQTAKRNPPVRLRIISSCYLNGSQLADYGLCNTARKHRQWLLQENEAWARRVFRFLAFINQSSWRGKQILKLIEALRKEDGTPNHGGLRAVVAKAVTHFDATNRRLEGAGKPTLSDSELTSVIRAVAPDPPELGVISAADDWVEETHRDFGRSPNDNEWARLRNGPLDGRIGMSYALQWRYNFGRIFNIG